MEAGISRCWSCSSSERLSLAGQHSSCGCCRTREVMQYEGPNILVERYGAKSRRGSRGALGQPIEIEIENGTGIERHGFGTRKTGRLEDQHWNVVPSRMSWSSAKRWMNKKVWCVRRSWIEWPRCCVAWEDEATVSRKIPYLTDPNRALFERGPSLVCLPCLPR